MQVLKPEDRTALLEFLRENASDSVLVTAVADAKAEREHVRNQFLSLTKYMGVRGGNVAEGIIPKSVAFSIPVETANVLPVNTTQVTPPPGEACTKIGGNTRADLLARCRNPTKPEVIGRAYYPHLKLLWSRKELTWDGACYQTAEGVR